MSDFNVIHIRQLISKLNNASYTYYQLDNPIMTDKEYDDKLDQLAKLEKETGIIYANSPTQKVQGYLLDGLEKVRHVKPMLSANKTKDIDEIKKFIALYDTYVSYKLDGLTLCTLYKDGKFVQGITRGNGEVGEDVTEACNFIRNLPMTIPYKGDLELRGECVISWDEFERINSTLKNPYSHPRNLAAGTLRNLDLNIVKDRELTYIVFEVVKGYEDIDSKRDKLYHVSEDLGFETVVHDSTNAVMLDMTIDIMSPENTPYPVDGLIFEIDSQKESLKLGKTSHHENCRMALKWEDELYETTLRDVVWQVGKTGVISPVAVFDPVDLDGAVTTKASVHNISIIKKLKLGIGDTIRVYRANMVIPQIHDNLTCSNNLEIPHICPECGHDTEIVKDNDTEILMCTNPNCKAKLLGKAVYFCSRDVMNIDGMSESTLKFLIDKGWVTTLYDIYRLDDYEDVWINNIGFGRQSVRKILKAIEKSRHTTLDRFICGLSIPLIGRSGSKDLANYVGNDHFVFDLFASNPKEFNKIKIQGFGEKMIKSLKEWFSDSINYNNYKTLLMYMEFETLKIETKVDNSSITGKSFVVTGKVYKYKNRKALQEDIEKYGGKVVGSVSKNTDFLINNDIDSVTGKNKKAKELGVKIISEDEFIRMIGK